MVSRSVSNGSVLARSPLRIQRTPLTLLKAERSNATVLGSPELSGVGVSVFVICVWISAGVNAVPSMRTTTSAPLVAS